jgi:hypothetical protein
VLVDQCLEGYASEHAGEAGQQKHDGQDSVGALEAPHALGSDFAASADGILGGVVGGGDLIAAAELAAQFIPEWLVFLLIADQPVPVL